MIGTIRKHSKWLWVIIIAVTIITFVFWMNPGGRNGVGGGGVPNLGSIGGQKVSREAYVEARNEVSIYYWLRYNQWPDRNPNISQKDLQQQIYVRLMLIQQGEKLGIHVGPDAEVAMANQILSSPELARAFGLADQSVPLADFVRVILQPEGLTAGDFENFVRHDLVMEQLHQAMGVSGELLTPQEIAADYERQNQKRATEIVFFSASNYLASVPVTPAAVSQFYTNYLAQYRLPDRVQVSYVAFPVTNFMAGAEEKLSKTNLAEQVEAIYGRYGTKAFPDAKTPEEAKAKIRELLIRQQALTDARQKADDFASTVFNMEPVRPGNLATVAKKDGLAVQVTAPFGKEYGPEDITNAPGFAKAAFGLTPDEPLAGPIVGQDAIYVIALAKQLPSEIPALDQIRARVTRGYQLHEATLRAQQAGTNFVHTVLSGLAAGKSFPSICAAAGFHSEVLPPFSMSTPDLSELGDQIGLNQLKPVAFNTPIGHASDFEQTDDGGFILYVKSQLPIDTAAMKADLPQFAVALRQQRASAAFDNWLEHTASRDLRNTPIFAEQQGNAAQ